MLLLLIEVVPLIDVLFCLGYNGLKPGLIRSVGPVNPQPINKSGLANFKLGRAYLLTSRGLKKEIIASYEILT